jgi:hypothetical protein
MKMKNQLHDLQEQEFDFNYEDAEVYFAEQEKELLDEDKYEDDDYLTFLREELLNE